MLLKNMAVFKAFFPKMSDAKKAVFDSAEELFDLPSETKLKNSSEKPSGNGYTAWPLYEAVRIDEPHVHENVEAFTNLFWPQGKPSFRDSVHSYSEHLSELDQTIIRKMIIESLGLGNDHLDEHMGSTYYHFRAAKYHGPKTNEGEIGLTSHTDKSILTILCQNQVDGLELQTKDGEWIHQKALSDYCTVFVGDSFHAWTNGRLHAPYHRVIMKGTEARYSIAFVSIPKDGCIIKAPEELIDEHHPLLYKPYDFAKFADFCFSKTGLSTQSALKVYCGV